MNEGANAMTEDPGALLIIVVKSLIKEEKQIYRKQYEIKTDGCKQQQEEIISSFLPKVLLGMLQYCLLRATTLGLC